MFEAETDPARNLRLMTFRERVRLAELAQGRAQLTTGRNSRSSLFLPPTSSFPHGRWTLTHFPSSPARLAAYLQPQEEQASLTAFSTASRVSPVRF
jgi:hypothetical protein